MSVREEIEATLQCEKDNLEEYEYGVDFRHKEYDADHCGKSNCQGWVEALEYVLGLMDRDGEEE